MQPTFLCWLPPGGTPLARGKERPEVKGVSSWVTFPSSHSPQPLLPQTQSQPHDAEGRKRTEGILIQRAIPAWVGGFFPLRNKSFIKNILDSFILFFF